MIDANLSDVWSESLKQATEQTTQQVNPSLMDLVRPFLELINAIISQGVFGA